MLQNRGKQTETEARAWSTPISGGRGRSRSGKGDSDGVGREKGDPGRVISERNRNPHTEGSHGPRRGCEYSRKTQQERPLVAG